MTSPTWRTGRGVTGRPASIFETWAQPSKHVRRPGGEPQGRPRSDRLAVLHQRIRGAVKLHGADGLEVDAEQLPEAAARGEPTWLRPSAAPRSALASAPHQDRLVEPVGRGHEAAAGAAGTDRGDRRAGNRRGLGQRQLSADPVPQRANRLGRQSARDGGPAPAPRAGVLPAPGVARHARPGRRHVRQAPRPQPQAGRGPPRRHAQGATPGRRPDRSPLPPARRGAARSRRRRRRAAGPAAINRAGDAAARGPSRPGELDAGRPEGPLRADGRAARRAEPVRRAVSEQDEVRRRAGRGGVADAVGAAGLPRTPRGGAPRRSVPCAARLRPGGAAAAHPP